MPNKAPNVASWNVHNQNTLTQTKAGLAALIAAGMDVIGCQEMSNDATWLACRTFMASKGYACKSPNNAVPIYVGPNWEIIDQGNESLKSSGARIEASTAGGNSSSEMGYKSVTWVSIRHRKTGASALVANTHIVPSIEDGGKLVNPLRLAWYVKQLAEVGQVTAAAVKAGIPVAVTGDFNLDYAKAGSDAVKRMAALGFTPCWTATKARGTHKDRTIDYVWHANMRARSVSILPKHGSDHSPVACDLTSSTDDKEEDPMASWDGTGAITAPTRARMTEILAEGKKAGITVYQTWGKVSDPDNTEHYTGRAIDFMIFDSTAKKGTDRGIGDWIAEYLWTHRVRLGVKWIIWRDRIRSTSPGHSGNWVNRGKGDHYDHVHVLFDTTAYKPLGPVKFLPVYIVDPAKVSTQMIGIPPAGGTQKLRDPGYRITTGVQIQTVGTRRFLVTDAGYRYDLSLLKLEGKTPPPPSAEHYPKPTSGEVYVDKMTKGTLDSDTVHYLQQALVKVLGDASKITPTGDYGDGTAAAIVAWKTKRLNATLTPAEAAALFKEAGITVKIEEKS